MESYVNWVSANPLFSAAVQFAVLGTLGEVLSSCIQKKRIALPCNLAQLAGKVLAWALLGIIIKYGFAGMKGFTLALLDHQMLPVFMNAGIGWAFAVSVLTNLFFGPQMMFFHRLEDNLISWKWDLTGLTRAWWTLIWFWIPAHTVTFSLPKEYQIGLAAVWSVVLGLIMGLTKK
ncbi:hypothetical protein CEE37_11815 [candidate division LCP-89 bacterium B3_LCP]|uniref:Uncharacterized protein n=1 Tax=candidate division LCP-89 bacterium B3_LCP TaxID=2012998 RepID=A0A532UVY1_UNCL8|nr:MAG: hypothetical protein CEE37_11815 [candidate division LCP-89 bacterium B3_LCP]